MSEPSYEELKAQLAEARKQASAATGGPTFKVSAKGAVGRMAWGAIRSHCITSNRVELLGGVAPLRASSRPTKAR